MTEFVDEHKGLLSATRPPPLRRIWRSATSSLPARIACRWSTSPPTWPGRFEDDDWSQKGYLIGLVHHSDRASQYTSITYMEPLGEARIAPSVGSVSDSFANALAETAIALFKIEVIRRPTRWAGVDSVEYATLE